MSYSRRYRSIVFLATQIRTGELTAFEGYPDEIAASDVCVKRHGPYKGHLLVCSLRTILVSEQPVYPS